MMVLLGGLSVPPVFFAGGVGMVILIAGGSHTGKTMMAQQLLENYRYPYLSIDHLKMGLIRSGHTGLTPCSPDEALTAYLWPICREIIKTAIENGQNLILEGCYIPFTWREDFEETYLSQIDCRWLIMTESYIRRNFDAIRTHANAIERRLDDSDLNPEELIADNARNLLGCRKHGCRYILIEDTYAPEWRV